MVLPDIPQLCDHIQMICVTYDRTNTHKHKEKKKRAQLTLRGTVPNLITCRLNPVIPAHSGSDYSYLPAP